MRSFAIVLGLVVACGGGGGDDDAIDAAVDAAIDASGPDAAAGNCGVLDEAGCAGRADCHPRYHLEVCDNITGYCAQYQACVDGAADCVGPASCDEPAPFCAGPYVVSFAAGCHDECTRAEACAGCRVEELGFTQANGCGNDGSVEFCIPPELEHAIALIAPTVTCAPGGGRAQCDPTTELLCAFPTADASTCVSTHGALTDAAWATICHLTMLPQVTSIVPTFAE